MLYAICIRKPDLILYSASATNKRFKGLHYDYHIVAWWRYRVPQIKIIGSRRVASQHVVITSSNVNLLSSRFCGIHFRVIFGWIMKIPIPKLCSKCTDLKSQRQIPVDSELIMEYLNANSPTENGVVLQQIYTQYQHWYSRFWVSRLIVILPYMSFFFTNKGWVYGINSDMGYTVKPVYNDHLMGYFSAFWTSSRWPGAT